MVMVKKVLNKVNKKANSIFFVTFVAKIRSLNHKFKLFINQINTNALTE